MRGHVPLLDHTAVVLNGQDHGIPEGAQLGELKIPDLALPGSTAPVWPIRSTLEQLTLTLQRRVL